MRWILILLMFLCSCQNVEKDRITQLVKEWDGKKIVFPLKSVFTVQGRDTVTHYWEDANYRIITYIDSVGCIDCKLQLPRWRDFISEVDSYSHIKVSFLIYFSTKDKSEIDYVLRRDSFMYPVCIDKVDVFNKLNHFSSDMNFQTFLLDKNNKVLAIGNPIHNPKVKELYLKIIQGEKVEQENESEIVKTELDIDKTSISLGSFDWQNEQNTTFILKNKGSEPLVIQYVNTSCGCTKVSYSQEPVLPDREIALNVTYKAEHPEHFNKTITVYCNVETSPIRLTISGDAK